MVFLAIHIAFQINGKIYEIDNLSNVDNSKTILYMSKNQNSLTQLNPVQPNYSWVPIL